ncbi:MAG TPA: ribonuclease H-like domain-containing protein [Candidatus Limnocylindrales bacterium]|nr:ribonuclease H-like domain-containing protein [Candidatus Limnocylindrales bacterium]
MSGATLERRLANYRSAIRTAGGASASDREPGDRLDGGVVRGSIELGRRLAEALDGELVLDPGGPVVRVEPATVVLPIDRPRLATLPGMPPADAPLVCIDTETTGLATASGTVAFLIGLGWWEADRFRQVQLLLPDHPAERGLLARLATHVPSDSWLVSYNGRGFDWPLLVARYRMAGVAAPVHAGHLDLLPFVRRVFRHRMADAKLKTVETELLGTFRRGDVDGWQIPGLFLDFLRGGEAWPLVDVVRHNREDVRSLGRLLGRIDGSFADVTARRTQPIGDLAGLSRAFGRNGRLVEALACLDAALASTAPATPAASRETPAEFDDRDADATTGRPWWDPRRPADVGGSRVRPSWGRTVDGRLDSPWTAERIGIERARLLRRLGRYDDAVTAWLDLTHGRGAIAIQAWIEVAKLREHRLGQPQGALDAALRATRLAEDRRRMGMGDPATELALRARLDRLRRRAGVDGRETPVGQAATRSRAIATEPPPPRHSVASP